MQPTPLPNHSSQLDPAVLNLMSGIKQVESQGNYEAKGKSGETGAYQYTAPTWQAWAGKYLGDPNADVADPANQNKVAYAHISELKQKGYNPEQIVSLWNSGKSEATGNVGVNSSGVAYDTPTYVKNVLSAAQQAAQARRQQQPVSGDNGGLIPTANAAAAETTGATPQQEDSPSVSGFIGNIASSAGGVVGGLAQAAMHPINTAQTLAGTAAGGFEKMFGVDNADTHMFDNAMGYFKNRYGGSSPQEIAHNIMNTAYKDPVGVALDLSTLLDGVGAAAGTVGKISDLSEVAKAGDLSKVSKIGEVTPTLGRAGQIGESIKGAASMINPMTPLVGAAKGIGSIVGKGATSIASHLTSIPDPAAIVDVIKNPELYSKMAMEQTTRGNLAEEFGKSLDKLEEQNGEAGGAYGPIRKSTEAVSVPENWLRDLLMRGTTADEESGKAIPFGLRLEKTPEDIIKGTPEKTNVVSDTSSQVSDPKAINAIQNFVDRWGSKTTMTPNEFLNMRKEAARMGRFGTDIGINHEGALVGRAIRADANKVMRSQIKDLNKADTEAAPLIQKFNQAKKDFLVKGVDGEYGFKAGAVNKIANAVGKGKDDLLARMESISPGITRKIQILKNVEAIESAFKIKAGTYVRGIMEGGAFLSGNVPLIIGTILTHPAAAVPILRGMGYTAKTVAPITNILRLIAGDPKLLKYFAEAGKTAKAGLYSPSSSLKP